ncbi:unnamed protein product [Boreogadus saida]
MDRRLRLETRGLQHRTRGPGLWLRSADGGAKTLEDDITLPTRILISIKQILRTTRTLPSRIPLTPELNLT